MSNVGRQRFVAGTLRARWRGMLVACARLMPRRSMKLRAANKKLEQHNALLDTALDNMVQGLVMFDANECVVVANDRFQKMYGLAPGQLQRGMTLRQVAEMRVASGVYEDVTVDAYVHLVRERVARGRVSHVTTRLANGRTIAVSLHPRADGGWVATHHDVTEREKLNARLEQQNRLLKEQEERLRSQNQQLDAALNNMVLGLAMFDAEARIIIANDAYAQLYGLTPEQVKPGTALREVVAHRIANGLYAGKDPDEVVKAMVDRARTGKVSHLVNKQADGRVISASVRPRDDGGWVVTHQDITERETLNAQLARQNTLLKRGEEELKAQNERFNAAINNMSQGLCLFDREQRVVFANRRFAELYNLTPDEVKPGTTLREIMTARIARGVYDNIDSTKFVDDGVASFNREVSQIVHLADGRFIAVLRRPMPDGSLVSTHEDVTERETLNAELERNNRLLSERTSRLQAIIDNFPGGITFLDGDLRCVLANDRAKKLLDLPDRLFADGPPPLESVFRFNAERGEYGPGNAEAQVAERMVKARVRVAHAFERQRQDGTVIEVRGVPLEDGGFVTIYMDATERHRSQAKIAHMALHDSLTDLPNRALLNERLEHALTCVKRGEIVAVHLLDLDHFKTVNDTMGHPAGDKLLKMVAARLHALVRDTDTIARMGGDEFAILQVAIAQPADATALALRVIEAVSAPYEMDGQQVIIGTSVGIAVGPTDGDRPDQLIRNADLALYRAKGDGRGTYRFFGPEMDAQMQTRRILEHDLRKALTAGQFELYYQPVVNLETDEISGVEALIRWRHPEKGIILPGAFIPVAEEIGFIIPLGEWAIREACEAAKNWPDNVRIAVNLSPIQFKNPGFVQLVVSALAASGLAPDRLELEITETTLLQDSETTLNTLYQLRALGVRIAVDDFGTGYSSLSYLQSFPFDKIKIDRSFVKDIADGVGSLNIVRAVAAMASGLGIETTAEGVETEEQLDTVRAEGCTEMQGFLFSRPLPADQIGQLLLARRKPQASGTSSAGCAA
jgi:diguanylate cyclase (GGDEF)-like protein/PAS domain S-box-containing protein